MIQYAEKTVNHSCTAQHQTYHNERILNIIIHMRHFSGKIKTCILLALLSLV